MGCQDVATGDKDWVRTRTGLDNEVPQVLRMEDYITMDNGYAYYRYILHNVVH